MKTIRKIVKIDEEKCDGCGVCVPACAEGALKVIDGKARLVSEVYCDGLGACLGECPNGAISIEERDAMEFDEAEVEKYLDKKPECPVPEAPKSKAPKEEEKLPCGCPGTMAKTIVRDAMPKAAARGCEGESLVSTLSNWPVQLNLAPVTAPFYQGARLLISADCAPFAFADFHRQFIDGRTVIMGCPKLDDTELYSRKLKQIFTRNDIRSVDMVYMEVPCCFGLVRLVKQAMEESGKKIPVTLLKIGIRGDILETETI